MQQQSRNKKGNYCIASTASILMPSLFSLILILHPSTPANALSFVS